MAKTIVVKQIGSPIRRPAVQRQTLIGLGLNKMHKHPRAGGHPRRARHGRQDPASGADHRRARLSVPIGAGASPPLCYHQRRGGRRVAPPVASGPHPAQGEAT
jgi:hypothetical protein